MRKMKKLNKKGFTLIELLAVIVVLAVIMLVAVTAVVPMMNRARKQAFITEANTFIEGAEAYFTYKNMSGDTTTKCVTIADLKGTYVEAQGKDKYNGKVELSGTDNAPVYTITLTDGSKYSISGMTNTALAEADESDVSDSVLTTGLTCTN